MRFLKSEFSLKQMKTLLKTRKYSAKQIHTLFLHSTPRAIEALISLDKKLRPIITRKEMIEIAVDKEASQRLISLSQHYTILKKLNFSLEELISLCLVSEKAIQVIAHTYTKLKKEGHLNKEIISLFSFDYRNRLIMCFEQKKFNEAYKLLNDLAKDKQPLIESCKIPIEFNPPEQDQKKFLYARHRVCLPPSLFFPPSTMEDSEDSLDEFRYTYASPILTSFSPTLP